MYMLFYKIKFSFLCTPIDKTTQKFFYKTKFSYLCTPIDKNSQKFFYKIKFSYQYRDSSMTKGDPFCARVFWRQMPVYTLLTDVKGNKTSHLLMPESNAIRHRVRSQMYKIDKKRLTVIIRAFYLKFNGGTKIYHIKSGARVQILEKK